MKNFLFALLAIVAIAGNSFAAAPEGNNSNSLAVAMADYNPYTPSHFFMNLDKTNLCTVVFDDVVADVFYTFNGVVGQERDDTKYTAGDTNCGPTGNKLCKIKFDSRITLAQALANMPAAPYTDGQTYTVTVTIAGVPTVITVTIYTKL